MSTDLESVLLRINRFGPPMLTRGSRGWWCNVPLAASVAGVTFEVKSDSTHPGPLPAAVECEARIHAAIAAMGAQAEAALSLPNTEASRGA